MIRFRKKSLVFSSVILIIIVFSVFQPAVASGFKSTLTDIIKFPLKFTHIILKEMKVFLLSHSIYRENASLRKEIDLLRKETVDLKELSRENERLRKLLDFKANARFTTTAARVIGEDSSNWTSALIIDKGRNHGLRAGMPVINEIGLVGKIIETSRSTSKILLINDPNSKVAGMIQESREEGIVSGTLHGKSRISFLSLNSQAETDNTVITSGLGGVFPKGLSIGQIINVDVGPSGLTKNCIIEPAANLSRIEEVLVVLK